MSCNLQYPITDIKGHMHSNCIYIEALSIASFEDLFNPKEIVCLSVMLDLSPQSVRSKITDQHFFQLVLYSVMGWPNTGNESPVAPKNYAIQAGNACIFMPKC